MRAGATGQMSGRTVLVTGATSGIGRATAAGLAGLGARVGIVGRDEERAEAVASAIRGASPAAYVDVFVADLSSQVQVRRLASHVLATYRRLDVLVNNVGGFWATRHVTADGLERTFAVNHLAPFLLTRLLLDRLGEGGPARIVVVASGAHTLGTIDFDDLQGDHGYSGPRAYNQSKLANVLFTYELARRLGPGPVTANALHPGMVRTGFGSEDQQVAWKVVAPVMRPFLRSPARGALTSIHLAASPEMEGVTGTYFADRRPKQSSSLSRDPAVAARLWQVSTDLVATTAAR
ncbi:MAG TPA: SDR family oxidoreductase [Intrasporangium sp.]|uniref:SDR family oxidoreductase n=1 Tax=Intrasporangium sp. TaxID=1925024 RepID=UPI002B46ABDE|nr:SDR family oxidoreductase [Intrasporangium sp.]HKX68950.1 SDR family oxidoreductase [Intrasporangium sp.]